MTTASAFTQASYLKICLSIHSDFNSFSLNRIAHVEAFSSRNTFDLDTFRKGERDLSPRDWTENYAIRDIKNQTLEGKSLTKFQSYTIKANRRIKLKNQPIDIHGEICRLWLNPISTQTDMNFLRVTEDDLKASENKQNLWYLFFSFSGCFCGNGNCQ